MGLDDVVMIQPSIYSKESIRIRPSAGASTLALSSSLARSCVFLYTGSDLGGAESISRSVPVNTAVSRSVGRDGPLMSFAGTVGAPGTSFLDFGDYSKTRNLGIVPATYAFRCRIADGSAGTARAALAGHSDANVANGWAVGTRASFVTSFGLVLIRSTADLRLDIDPTSFCQKDFVFVVTHDGGNNANNAHMYVNGVELSPTRTNGSGTAGPALGEHLFLGRNRLQNGGDLNGSITLAAFFAKQFSYTEVRDFTSNVQQLVRQNQVPQYAIRRRH